MTPKKRRPAQPTAADRAAADRLRAIWNAKKTRLGLTQESMGARMGGSTPVTQGAISQYLHGKIPLGYRALMSFADALQIDPHDVRSDLPEQQTGSDWDQVLGYAQAAGMGSGPEAAEWARTHKLMFRRDSLARKRLIPDNLRVMYGIGDSMEPTINEGDAILFDTSDTTPKNRGVYVLLIDGAGADEYSVKRYRSSVKGFVADNPDGDHEWKSPRPVSAVRVVGRVRWIGRWI